MLLYIETRINASFEHKQVDIFSLSGLEAMASTGFLSDHLEWLPPFTKEEVKTILEYILSRDLDENDPYQFYILKDGYSNEDLTISVFKNNGLIIQYKNPQYNNDMPYCIIEHKGLSTIFSDFAENYVPTMLALSQEEAHAFIEGLIEKYCLPVSP